ncbi:MAG: UvrD-helicase domain-containing protein [Brachymonas sp.]|nr:UvrD-helicase domain-containing protein [Brachymonas sp.]
MSELTRALIACFADLKRERGWVDMNDLEQAALHLLRDEQLSGWVQQRLDAQLRHVLIDEFQDTNPLQWQALQSWLSSYVGSGGGREGGSAPSVFIVGDAKQSIYRFRRAEPQVFEAATQFVCEQLGGTLLSCDHTRRNAQGVVALVNAVMSQAATELPYAFRPHTTESEQTGEIIRLPLAPQPEKALAGDEMVWRDTLTTPRDEPQEYAADAECQLAARWVAGQIAQGLIGPDIMVLARKRDRLERMRDALRLLGVASQITEKTALIDLPEVQDVVALLDAAVSPGNDLALARALRSPLLGWRDDDLVALALAVKSAGAQAAQASAVLQDDTNKTISWWDMLTKEEHSAHILCRLDANLASKTRLQLLQLQSLLQALPPHDALSRMVSEQDWVARCMAAAPAPLRQRVQQSLHALLAAALEIGSGRFLTPHKFVRELKKPHLKAPQTTSADDAVRLMTIHGAKGLEAHTVLLLDSLSAPPAAAILDVLVDWPGAQAAPQTFAFLRSEAKAPECVSAALAHEQEQRAREEINAMYVAMTRAKSRLVFSAHESARQAATGCLWRRLEALPESVATLIEDAWAGDFAALPQTLIEDTFTLNIMPNERLAGTEYAQSAIKKEVNQATDDDSSSRDASHWGDEVQRRIGIAMHRLLELYRPGADWHESIASVTAAVQLSEPQALQALESAQRIVHGQAAWVWGDAVDWQANEVELFHEAQVLRLDRLVRRRDTQAWWVIDYKSSDAPQHNRALRLQLTQYVEAVKSAFSESGKTAVVHAAFITAQGRWVQIL